MKSETFETTERLRQGHVMSPLSFNIFMDEIMKRCNRNVQKNLCWIEKYAIQECTFTHDAVIIADNEKYL